MLGNDLFSGEFRLLKQNPTDWVAQKQQIFIAHGSGGWNSEIREAAWSGQGPLLLTDISCLHMAGRTWELCGVSFRRALIPFTGAAHS